jgi:hypothetical protein
MERTVWPIIWIAQYCSSFWKSKMLKGGLCWNNKMLNVVSWLSGLLASLAVLKVMTSCFQLTGRTSFIWPWNRSLLRCLPWPRVGSASAWQQVCSKPWSDQLIFSRDLRSAIDCKVTIFSSELQETVGNAHSVRHTGWDGMACDPQQEGQLQRSVIRV